MLVICETRMRCWVCHMYFMLQMTCAAGVYWGSVSWPYCMEVVEASDVVISVGCVWTDYR